MPDKIIKKWQSQLLKGTLELYILALISHQSRYAFEIIQELKQLDGLVSEGSIYPLLKRLQKEGLISTFWSESHSGPPRKYYQLTDLGTQVLTLMTQEWTAFSKFLNTTLERKDTNESTQPGTSDHPIPLEIRQSP